MSLDSIDLEVEVEGVRVEPNDDPKRWNELVERSPHTTPFHRAEALDLQASYADAENYRLVGYKGHEPVGLLPVFERSAFGTSVLLSPAPGLKVPSLGPALVNVAKLKPRRREKRHRRFLASATEWLDSAFDPRYVHLRTNPRYEDPRPLSWCGFELTPRHTFVVPLDAPPETLLKRFSSDARGNVTGDVPDAVLIEEAGTDAIRRIVDHVATRHDEQGEPYPLSAAFVVDLYETLPDGAVRIYECTVDGEYATGMVTVEREDTVYRWQGGAIPLVDRSVNDRLDWRIMTDAIDRGRELYDLVGANDRRISEYKSKWAPDVVEYYRAERGGGVSKRVASLLGDVIG